MTDDDGTKIEPVEIKPEPAKPGYDLQAEQRANFRREASARLGRLEDISRKSALHDLNRAHVRLLRRHRSAQAELRELKAAGAAVARAALAVRAAQTSSASDLGKALLDAASAAPFHRAAAVDLLRDLKRVSALDVMDLDFADKLRRAAGTERSVVFLKAARR